MKILLLLVLISTLLSCQSTDGNKSLQNVILKTAHSTYLSYCVGKLNEYDIYFRDSYRSCLNAVNIEIREKFCADYLWAKMDQNVATCIKQRYDQLNN
jgi:hypothetical protein